MQTFLPYSDFKLSASVLDNKRLGKQRVEALQILKTLKKGPYICTECKYPFSYGCCGGHGKPKSTPWYNHPSVKMWEGYEQSLMYYLHAMCYEWTVNRGFKDICWEKSIMVGFRPPNVGIEPTLPPWIGNEEIHSSHRSRLLFKGRVDAVCSTLKKDLKTKGLKFRSINDWLRMCNYPEKNVMKLEDVLRLERIATEGGLTIEPNFYAQYNWTDVDTNPYIWPVKKETASN